MKRLWLSLTIIIGLLAIILFGASLYFYHVAIMPGEKTFIKSTQQLKSSDPLYQQKKWFVNVPKKHWQQTSQDGLKLVADYVPAKKPTHKTAIVAHGFMGSKEKMGAYAALFHQLGYNVLLPDNRSQGASQGNAIGYGWLDRKDYLNWARQVIRKNGTKSQIIMFGVSMGASGMVMASGEPQPTQIKAYIADSPFTSADAEITHQAQQLYHLPKWPLVPLVSLITKVRAGYSFKEANALKQIQKNHKPIFLIAGTKDTFVPYQMSQQLYAYANQPKKLWLVPNAKHVTAFDHYPTLYTHKIKGFLTHYLP